MYFNFRIGSRGVEEMGRRAKHSAEQLQAAIAFYTNPAGQPSVLSVSARFNIPETSLRREIRRRGIVQGPVAAKRQRVYEHFRGPDLASPAADLDARQTAGDGMEDSLTVARRVVRRLGDMVDETDDPRALKAIAECNNVAMETIRKIRGLDAPLDFASMSDEQLERIAAGKSPL